MQFNAVVQLGDLLNSIATAVVGFFAIYLYKKQQFDHKKEVASLLLTEINNAEIVIAQLKETNFAGNVISNIESFRSKIVLNLKVESWSAYRHLFVNILDPSEFKSLNDFYKFSILLQEELNRCRQIYTKLVDTKFTTSIEEMTRLALKEVDVGSGDRKVADPTSSPPLKEVGMGSGDRKFEEIRDVFQKKCQKFFNLVNMDTPLSIPNDVISQIQKNLQLIEKISTSNVGFTLKKIAGYDNHSLQEKIRNIFF